MDTKYELVLDALYDRHDGMDNTCLHTNQAGLILLESPASIIPAIEEVLLQIVEPALAAWQEDSAIVKLQRLLGEYSDLARHKPFPGLDYVLGSYLVIGAKSDWPRVARFLLGSSESLLAEAIMQIPVFFKPPSAGFGSCETLPSVVRRFLVDLSKTDKTRAASVAACIAERTRHIASQSRTSDGREASEKEDLGGETGRS